MILDLNWRSDSGTFRKLVYFQKTIMHFLWVFCWFLSKNLINFDPPKTKLYNQTYEKRTVLCFSLLFSHSWPRREYVDYIADRKVVFSFPWLKKGINFRFPIYFRIRYMICNHAKCFKLAQKIFLSISILVGQDINGYWFSVTSISRLLE